VQYLHTRYTASGVRVRRVVADAVSIGNLNAVTACLMLIQNLRVFIQYRAVVGLLACLAFHYSAECGKKH